MNEKNIKNKSDKKIDSRTDWERVRSMKDEEIDYSDIPKTSQEFWEENLPISPVFSNEHFKQFFSFKSPTKTILMNPPPSLNAGTIIYYQALSMSQRTFTVHR